MLSVSLDRLLSGRNSEGMSGVQRGFDGESATLEDVGVDHGGFYIFVTEQFLDGANVVSALEKMGGKRMTQGMRGDVLVDLCLAGGFTNGSLDDRFMDVMAARDARAFVLGKFRCRKEVLPDPFPVCVRVLLFESHGQMNCPKAIQQVSLVDEVYLFEMQAEGFDERIGQDGEAIVLPFSVADDDLVVVEVDIFDAQAQGFHDAQSASVHDLGDELRCACKVG